MDTLQLLHKINKTRTIVSSPDVSKPDALTSLITGLIGSARDALATSITGGTPSKTEDLVVSTETPQNSNEVRRAQPTPASVKDDEYEKRLREERMKIEQEKQAQEQAERDRSMEQATEDKARAEMVARREKMLKQLEELKEAEERQRVLLEQERLQEEERLRLIAEKQEELEFASVTSTTDSSMKLKYKLRPQQCAAINKFTRVFNVTDPSDWIQKNCVFAKRYFPEASCPQIQALIESCFAFL